MLFFYHSLAVEYLFRANDGFGGPHDLASERFDARDTLNDYEVRLVERRRYFAEQWLMH